MRVSVAYLAGRCDCPWAFMAQGVSLGRHLGEGGGGGVDQNQTALTTISHALLKGQLKVGQRCCHGALSCTSYCSVIRLPWKPISAARVNHG